MILAKGRLYDSKEQDLLLNRMEEEIDAVLASRVLPMELVIDAVDRLGKRLKNGDFDEKLQSLSLEDPKRCKQMAIDMMSREAVEYKVACELGKDFFTPFQTISVSGRKGITAWAAPLGVLLHIAAGNVDGLPAFSLIEGLLTGNVNIIKLPQGDNGLSLDMIAALVEEEPLLSDFIYVFDTPSDDIQAIKRMAALSDGIVVWGGDEAVTAVRRFAPVGTRLIEWGHKLGFAYLSGYEDKDAELEALAEHIVTTKQLLCSSCQTIFLDTENMEEVYEFCRFFLPILEAAAKRHSPVSIGLRAELTLLKYNSLLNNIMEGGHPSKTGQFQAEGCSLTACEDSELELSGLYGGCLVKRLPQSALFTLRRKKGYLQTAGLICSPKKRRELTDLLGRCGVVRITRAGTMSEMFNGEAHDGEYPLRRYMRMVNVE